MRRPADAAVVSDPQRRQGARRAPQSLAAAFKLSHSRSRTQRQQRVTILAVSGASVVIPTYNRRDQIADTVGAVLRDPEAAEVVVVVDGCRDGTLEVLQSLAESDQRLKPVFVENGGEGKARQIGSELAQNDVIVFLDDDVIPGPSLISGHVAAAAPGTVVLGYMPMGHRERRHRGDYPLALYERVYLRHVASWEEEADHVLDAFWAGNFSMWRDDALRVGLDNPSVEIDYHADYDFGVRCRAAGLTATFDRSLRAGHHMSRSPAQFRRSAFASGRALATLGGRDKTLSNLDQTKRSALLSRLAKWRLSAYLTGLVLVGTTEMLGILRCFRTQERFAGLLQTVDTARGARSVRPRRPSGLLTGSIRPLTPDAGVIQSAPLAGALRAPPFWRHRSPLRTAAARQRDERRYRRDEALISKPSRLSAYRF